MALNKMRIFAPIPEVAAEWGFYPSDKIKAIYPDAPVEFLGMEVQEGEVLKLKPLKFETLEQTAILTIKEGRVELINFDSNWQELDSIPDDPDFIWDAEQMCIALGSDD